MAIRTAVASGNWSATGTWSGGVVPVAPADQAVIPSGINVTLDVTTSVGEAGVTGTPALTIESGGTLTRNAGSVLTLYGDMIYQKGATIVGGAGAHIILRPPGGAQYHIRSSLTGTGRVSWTENAVTGNRTRFSTDTTDGGINGCVRKWGTGANAPQSITALWNFVELVDLGTSDDNNNGSGLWIVFDADDSFTWNGGLMHRCGKLRTEHWTGAETFDIQNVSIRQPLLTTRTLHLAGNGNALTTGIRRLKIDGYTSVMSQIDDSLADVDWGGSVLCNMTHVASNAALRQSGSDVFMVHSDTNSSWGFASNGGCVLSNFAIIVPGDLNPHPVGETGADNLLAATELQDFVLDGYGLMGGGADIQGDIIPQRDMWLRRGLFIGNGGNITGLAAAARIFVDRCTFTPVNGINLGEAAGSATQLQQCKHTLFYGGDTGITQDASFVSQTDAIINFNGFYGITKTGVLIHPTLSQPSYMGPQSVANWWSVGAYGDADKGADDIYGDPGFVDSTRNASTWQTANGGSGGLPGLIGEVVKVHGYDINGNSAVFDSNYSLSNYLSYIRTGWTPTNSIYQGAGDPVDGSPDIGAVPVSANDTTAPTVAAFAINNPSVVGTTVINIDTFNASDNLAVTGYLITESGSVPSLANPGWSPSAQTQYDLGSYRNATLWPWARDAAGNISAVFGTPIAVSAASSGGNILVFGQAFNGRILA